MALKARVFFSSSRNGKGTSLHLDEGGFVLADSRPLILGFLVRCGEGGLHSGEPVAFCCCLFVISAYVLFFCLLAALLIPTSPYSMEQYNMRD